MLDINTPQSLYLHVPFCQQRCWYCDFESEALLGKSKEQGLAILKQYSEKLIGEIQAQPTQIIKTIYFGGGTPSILPSKIIEKVLMTIQRHFQVLTSAEITLEVNPGVGQEWLECSPIINRISIGAQAFNDELLQYLGRIHRVEDIYQTYKIARAKGYRNINLDLIFAIPGQSLSVWQASLEQALALQPEHISLYNLTTNHGEETLLNNQELDLAMYQLAIELLVKAGYEHYEISNFAKPGFQSQHNLAYWRNEPYLGIGQGAVSSSTLDDPVTTIIMGLRLIQEGLALKRFKQRHGKDLLASYGDIIENLQKRGLLELRGARSILALTRSGLFLANQVMMDFV